MDYHKSIVKIIFVNHVAVNKFQKKIYKKNVLLNVKKFKYNRTINIVSVLIAYNLKDLHNLCAI